MSGCTQRARQVWLRTRSILNRLGFRRLRCSDIAQCSHLAQWMKSFGHLKKKNLPPPRRLATQLEADRVFESLPPKNSAKEGMSWRTWRS